MIHDIFSKRGEKLPEIFVYDTIPNALRTQFVYILDRTLKLMPPAPDVYARVADILKEEYGVFQFHRVPGYLSGNKTKELHYHFLNTDDHKHVLDVIELALRLLIETVSSGAYYQRFAKLVGYTVGQVNQRFKEHGIGYEFVERYIIRKDSEYIHSEVVKPALAVLHNKKFEGARDEFLQAHGEYRKGNHKAAINECLKSLESLMKSICDSHRWSYPSNPTATSLIDTCFKNNLIPSFWKSHFGALGSLLKSGVPTGRNRLSAHGQGQQTQSIPDHIVQFLLHQTATCLVFLGDADKELP